MICNQDISHQTPAVSQAQGNPDEHQPPLDHAANRMAWSSVMVYPRGWPNQSSPYLMLACDVRHDMAESTTLDDVFDGGLRQLVRSIQVEFNLLNVNQCLDTLRTSRYDYQEARGRLYEQQADLNNQIARMFYFPPSYVQC